EQTLLKTGLSPHFLELLIPEAIVLEAERSLDILIQLKKIGVQICLDEFGLGYSSLTQLSRYPVNRLRIDRTFVQQSTMNRENETVVKMI
ncbi:EAL domain-containing protein, partial [Bacillus sp. SIMBA_069]